MWLKFWSRGKTSRQVSDKRITFRCNICGSRNACAMSELGREIASCTKCGSTVRMRSIIHLLSTELFGNSIALPDFPIRQDIQGIGMSDWDGYAIPLTKKLGYQNTYYHKDPKLDITAIDPAREGTLDFIISTDVFEHIVPPVSIAFENTLKLLKSNGVFIFTVPYTKEDETKEHFPELLNFKIIKMKEAYELHNVAKNGEKQVFRELVFHGGEGATIEMRVFSEKSLLTELNQAGFKNITTYKEPFPEFGIYWNGADWSLPMAIKKL